MQRGPQEKQNNKEAPEVPPAPPRPWLSALSDAAERPPEKKTTHHLRTKNRKHTITVKRLCESM
jgi:hypothetical protein